MIVGSVDGSDGFCGQQALDLGILVASVEYRLAPEHPYPAPIEDCYAGLKWFAGAADELGIDPARIAIGGGSAGGGLCAGLALLARDRGEIDVCFQLLVYPMIDDRNSSDSSHAITDPRLWNREKNLIGWGAYLAGGDGGEDVPPYAAPARATNLEGLAARLHQRRRARSVRGREHRLRAGAERGGRGDGAARLPDRLPRLPEQRRRLADLPALGGRPADGAAPRPVRRRVAAGRTRPVLR